MEKVGRLIKNLFEEYIKNNLELTEFLFIVRYSQLSAPQLSMFRNIMNTHCARFLVVKNSIAARVFKSKGYDGLLSILEGPCGIVFGKGDPVVISKAIFDFAKENVGLEVKGGLLKESLLSSAQVMELSKLPGRQVLYTQLAQLLNMPLGHLIFTLKEIPRRLVVILNGIKEKKGGKDDRGQN